MLNDDNIEYYRFTGPQRLDKAIHTLEGIVHGISVDGKVNSNEIRVLTHWICEHAEFSTRHPFNEVIPRLNEILADGVIDDEERADILWLCERFTTADRFFCAVSSDMQRLQGMMGGIAADGVVTTEELEGLREWMDERRHLRTCWPYDELESLIDAVLKDGRIDNTEHRALLAFLSEFMEYPGHRALELPIDAESVLVSGVCARCPEIVFPGRLFSFSGKSKHSMRKQLAELVERNGGQFHKSVVMELDYLVIGADGNPCWAFACYGRKVETAIEYRKQGCRIVIVHEDDFWEAAERS